MYCQSPAIALESERDLLPLHSFSDFFPLCFPANVGRAFVSGRGGRCLRIHFCCSGPGGLVGGGVSRVIGADIRFAREKCALLLFRA